MSAGPLSATLHTQTQEKNHFLTCLHFEEIKLDLGNCKKMYAKLSKELKWGITFGISH